MAAPGFERIPQPGCHIHRKAARAVHLKAVAAPEPEVLKPFTTYQRTPLVAGVPGIFTTARKFLRTNPSFLNQTYYRGAFSQNSNLSLRSTDILLGNCGILCCIPECFGGHYRVNGAGHGLPG